MKIVGRPLLIEFCKTYPAAKSWTENWLADTRSAQWKTPQEIKNRYASASFVAGNCVIFNVGGNKFRMEARIAYNAGVVLITWIGTHAEYSRRQK
jgi:mRNA interferase HigB